MVLAVVGYCSPCSHHSLPLLIDINFRSVIIGAYVGGVLALQRLGLSSELY